MDEILQMADQTTFRKFVLTESIRKKHGDYYVYLSDVVKHFSDQQGYEKSLSALNTLLTNIKQLNGGAEPILFYPRAETIAKNQNIREETITSEAADSNLSNDVIAVYQNVYNPDYSAPGYVRDNNGNLVFKMNVTEEYAWNNNVYVIGDEEGSGYIRESVAVQPKEERIDGEPEYGAIIQLTNMDEIEHWTAGMFEFRYIVHSSSGVVLTDKRFSQTSRDDFKNQRWQDYLHFIANGNVGNIGNWMHERWIEEDGGLGKTTIMQTIPPGCTGCPSYSVTFTIDSKDDDLGPAFIQYTDNKLTQVYPITYANVKRK